MAALTPPLNQGIRAVVFDVDGTLYDQSRLRRTMALRLMGHLMRHPLSGPTDVRILRAFRHAQERLREGGTPAGADSMSKAQLQWAAREAGVSPETARRVTGDWMFHRPLDAVRRYVFSGLRDVLTALQSRGLKLGVYSDYPAEEKLAALGIAELFNAVASSYDDDIRQFKPDPAGFLSVARRLGVSPGEAAYVGDRPDVDVAGARAAGLWPVLIDPRGRHGGGDCATIRNLRELIS